MGRNIVITPNRSSTGSTQQPNISFSGLSAGTISLLVEDDGSLVYDGTYGSLFSISDNKDGLLHSVNDVSGLPIFQVWDDNRVILGIFNNPALTISASTAFVGPTATTTSILHISGGSITYKDGNQGANKVLVSDTNGVASWQTLASTAFTGGTVSGATNFTGGLTANTISATTITGSGSGLTNIPISGVTNLQSNLDNKFDKSGGTVTGSVLITGDVTVLGTATTINTQTLTVKDNIITINSNYSGSTAPYPGTSGIEVLRGSATTATLLWDETSQKWVVGVTGDTKQIIVSGDSLSLLNSGHTHPISEIINLQSSLDNKFDKSGGTVSGATNFTNGLSANTISATTYLNLPVTTDTYVTGFTYSNNTYSLSRNNGLSALTQTVNTMTGLTINGNLTVSGGTQSWFSGNSSLNLVRITQTGSGNAFVVEDSANPDSTPFTISNDGRVSISTNPAISPTNSKFSSSVYNDNYPNAILAYAYNGGATEPSTQSAIIAQAVTSNNIAIGIDASAYGVAGGDYSPILSIGGKFSTNGNSAENYAVQLIDGTEGLNKVLISKTTDGKANWSNSLSGLSSIYTNTISATTYYNLPVTADTFVTGFTYSNNTYTISRNNGLSALTQTVNTMTGLTVNGNLTVTGNTSVRGLTGTSATISGSAQNILTIIGSGSTSPLFTVVGSTGELFSITDSLTGSLFSVNDISGLPILEVFSDNTTLMGNYLAPSLNTTARVTLTAGTNTIYSIPTSAYTGAFFDYTVISSGTTGARAGNIMAIWSGTSAQYTEVSTNDIGNTAGVTFSVAVSGNNAVLSSSATTAGWTLKTIIRSI